MADDSCPKCGGKVEIKAQGGDPITPSGPQSEYGECQKGHKLTRALGPITGVWKAF